MKQILLGISKQQIVSTEIDIVYIFLQFCPFGLNLDSNLNGMVQITIIIVEVKYQSRLHVHSLQVKKICA